MARLFALLCPVPRRHRGPCSSAATSWSPTPRPPQSRAPHAGRGPRTPRASLPADAAGRARRNGRRGSVTSSATSPMVSRRTHDALLAMSCGACVAGPTPRSGRSASVACAAARRHAAESGGGTLLCRASALSGTRKRATFWAIGIFRSQVARPTIPSGTCRERLLLWGLPLSRVRLRGASNRSNRSSSSSHCNNRLRTALISLTRQNGWQLSASACGIDSGAERARRAVTTRPPRRTRRAQAGLPLIAPTPVATNARVPLCRRAV